MGGTSQRCIWGSALEGSWIRSRAGYWIHGTPTWDTGVSDIRPNACIGLCFKEKKQLGADVVAYGLNCCLRHPLFHIRVLVWALTSTFSLAACCCILGSSRGPESLGPCHPHGRPGWSSRYLVSPWFSPGCYSHLGTWTSRGNLLLCHSAFQRDENNS